MRLLLALLCTVKCGILPGAEGPGPEAIRQTRLESGTTVFHQGDLGRSDTGEYICRGTLLVVDPQGRLRTVGRCDAEGRKDGVWSMYDEEGNIIQLRSYAKGELSGAWLDFDERTHRLGEQRFYQHGKQVGRSVWFDAQGKALEGPTQTEREAVPRAGSNPPPR